ncbi:MAG: cell division protein ZapA [Fibrobacter sp.]|nr:cell division protein ZapA [Fibrobacter sp.]
MGSSTESVRVVIFGNEYSIKGDVNSETTRQIAQYVNSKMASIQENSASRDQMKIAVLSALNIAGELFELQAKFEDSTNKIRELENIIVSLNKKIDGALQ